MLYAAEIWGFNKINSLEVVQNKFLKYALKLKTNTHTAMILLETGFLPVKVEVQVRMITFWVNLLTGRQDKLSYKFYIICLSLYKRRLIIFDWLKQIETIINYAGFTFVFQSQLQLDKKYLRNTFLPQIKNVLKDQAIQELFSTINNNPENFYYYRHLISRHKIQDYLLNMPAEIWIPLVKIRTQNHKLPVEVYSWHQTFLPRAERKCTICNRNEIGDELHFAFFCPVFDEDRKKLLPGFADGPKTLVKFIKLLNSSDITILRGFTKLLTIIFGVFQ